ncbi:small conductance mechanosensitive channel [Zhouia amylolytica]|uniref:Small conductance mechanosensitive channel n=1 Tax=Zhouia amylolytica TaxID=376730 RepID=A0A1I6VCB8_9FLAO|nr:mechanosensitive ion channel domain-containing protein [Zhouia amylolytica]MCQ0110406.1 mechanosensitive ion channel [Zhouia amylolytica]SFT11378.1 small conductance mechanosensitive channel [Zhouia amylolytica]
MKLEDWFDQGIDWNLMVDYGIKIAGAIVIWIIGSWIVKKIVKGVDALMTKRAYEISLRKFLVNLLKWVLIALLVIVVLGTIGVETTSFAAIIAAAGLAIGLALQGSLGNFAGGALIMIFKPIKVGDLIEAQGELGVVNEIQIFTTILTTPDNKTVVIPNGPLSNGNIKNYSKLGKLRVDLTVGVAYDSDIKQTKDVLMEALTSNPKVLKEPAPTIAVSELADSSINFAVRPWATTADYWDVYFGSLEACKKALDVAGIEIPFPHQVEIRKNV